MSPASDSPAGPTEPRRRVILLGASNLTRAIGTVVETARRTWHEPLEIMAALGRGRSYGRTTSVLLRSLPGILDCGLWRALSERPPLPTAALLTDVGNDLLYEEPVARILAWVGVCLDRLSATGAQTVVTLLPTKNIFSLSERRFQVARRLFVPGCTLSLAEVTERAIELSAGVGALAAARGMCVVEQQSLWYGWDPMHIRYALWPSAWGEILSGWRAAGGAAPRVPKSLLFSLYLQTFCHIFL